MKVKKKGGGAAPFFFGGRVRGEVAMCSQKAILKN
jgi:hypothetical protein